MHQSIPVVPIPTPEQPRGICSRWQSQGWGICNFIAARELGISIPRSYPRAFDTRVFERWMGTGKDAAFVKDWLVRQGLEKLVNVFKGICFLNFWYFVITCKHINISDKVNYILVIIKQSLMWKLREHDYFAFHIYLQTSQAIFKFMRVELKYWRFANPNDAIFKTDFASLNWNIILMSWFFTEKVAWECRNPSSLSAGWHPLQSQRSFIFPKASWLFHC